MRMVPRNIDRPNRNAEYAFTMLTVYYTTMFTIGDVLLAWGLTILSGYLTYRLTLNKPEGNAYRVWYKRFGFGKMLPNPRRAPKFEV